METNSGSLKFDGQILSGETGGISSTIRIIGRDVRALDVGKVLVIRGGEGFIPGTYRIERVEKSSNSWTVDRRCSNGEASRLTGEYIIPVGRDRESTREYFDPHLPNNPSQGEAQSSVREVLNAIQPAVLQELARRCFNPELLAPAVTDLHDWPGPPDNLEWGHIKSAGQIEPSMGVVFANLMSLKTAIVGWAKDEPERRWNLCNNEKEPLGWIAAPAIHTLLWWLRKGRLPQVLRWEDFELHCYRSLASEREYRMFELERHFDAGAGFHRIAPEEGNTTSRLSAREQRKAAREYKSLGKELELERMQSISLRYFKWYVLRTFFEFKLREIRQKELESGRFGVGDPQDPNDFTAIAHGIKKVGTLVGFKRSPRKIAMIR